MNQENVTEAELKEEQTRYYLLFVDLEKIIRAHTDSLKEPRAGAIANRALLTCVAKNLIRTLYKTSGYDAHPDDLESTLRSIPWAEPIRDAIHETLHERQGT